MKTFQGTTTFIGCRPRNRNVLQRRMYRNEIDEWMKEAERSEKRMQRFDNEEEHIIVSTDHVILGAGTDRRSNDVLH